MALKLDTQLNALGSLERRRILAGLLARGATATMSLTSLTQQLDGDATRAIVQLHHVHVPLLVDLGLVTRADDGDAVRRGDAFDDVRPLVDLLVDHDDNWPGEWETPVPSHR